MFWPRISQLSQHASISIHLTRYLIILVSVIAMHTEFEAVSQHSTPIHRSPRNLTPKCPFLIGQHYTTTESDAFIRGAGLENVNRKSTHQANKSAVKKHECYNLSALYFDVYNCRYIQLKSIVCACSRSRISAEHALKHNAPYVKLRLYNSRI